MEEIKNVEEEIPIVETLEEIYEADAKQMEEEHISKYMIITRRFEEIYDGKPEFFSRVPSRVKLLGDHIEYSDYPSISAALEQDIIIAFKQSSEPYFEINNFIENLYRGVKIPVGGSMKPLEGTQDKWANSIIQGISHILKQLNVKPEQGIQMLIFSSLLEDSGIGSEDALIVAAEVMTYKIYGNEKLEKKKCVIGLDSIPALYSIRNTVMEYDLHTRCYFKFPGTYSFSL